MAFLMVKVLLVVLPLLWLVGAIASWDWWRAPIPASYCGCRAGKCQQQKLCVGLTVQPPPLQSARLRWHAGLGLGWT